MGPTPRRDFLRGLAGAALAGAGLTAAGVLAPRALLGAPLGTSGGAPDTPTNTYTNPVYPGSVPDPGVLRHGGAYYAFGTTGTGRAADGRVFTVLRSADLAAWQPLGGALVPPDPDPRYQYWAPEAVAHGGKFYLYYAMGGVEEERFALRVATSDHPEGPYTDTGRPLVDAEHNRFTIDPHPFQDVDGQWYLFYARNYPNSDDGFHPGTGLAVDRLVGMTALAGEGRTVLRARYPWTLFQANRRMEVYGRTFDWHTIEAPWVTRHGGKYYCFYSGSNWRTERYGVDYAVADHVLGPYTGQGKEARVLRGVPGHVRGPGHHSVVEGTDGHDWIVYHAWNRELTVRQLCVDRLSWGDGAPRCEGPTDTPQKGMGA